MHRRDSLRKKAALPRFRRNPPPVRGSQAPWPPPKDLNELFQLEYKTYRVDETKPYDLAVLGESRVRLVFPVIDGGCITAETLTVREVEMGADNVTTLHLLYALDGRPCKALFKRVLDATFRLPKPGVYRIRLWVNELYYSKGEEPAPVKEITI
ncbi:MAG: hypothetical protein M0C28_35340 [Candidatus Moduliflexus flocculans]|nr:hypothetical protein [Candidatus Moduliflexus flocculans]